MEDMMHDRRFPHYEEDNERFPDKAYAVEKHRGVAWYALGWETEPDEDTHWSEYEQRTGKVVCVMVGDDHRWLFDPEDLVPLDEGDWCPGCGQLGCKAYGVEKEEG